MKKLLFAFMLGVFAIFSLPSCSGGSGSAAADKLADMKLTQDNKDEFIKTFETAVDDLTQALKDKDEAKANEIAEKLSKAMDQMDGDVLSDSEKMTLGLKVIALAEEAEKAGIKLE